MSERRPTTSVVIPHYDDEERLLLTLAALAHDTYDAGLVEVIVVDDGSPSPPRPDSMRAALGRPVVLVEQPRQGFRAGAARNLGVEAAAGEVVIFLDSDMVPDEGFISSHAAWHAANPREVVIGARSHVEISDEDLGRTPDARLAGRSAWARGGEPAWRQAVLAATDDLRATRSRGWRLASTGNLSVRRETFDLVGPFDERFWGWGGEDIEWGFRAYQSGCTFRYEPRAHAWHQGLLGTPSPDELRSQTTQRRFLASLVADTSVRTDLSPRTWEVPLVRVSISAGSELEALLELVDGLLVRIGDVGVDVTTDDGRVRATYEAEPRVRVASPTREDASAPSAWERAPVRVWLWDPAGVSGHDVHSAVRPLVEASVTGVVLRRGGVQVGVAALTSHVHRYTPDGVPPRAVIDLLIERGEEVVVTAVEETSRAGTAGPAGYVDALSLGQQRLRAAYWRLPAGVRNTILRLLAGRPDRGSRHRR